MGNHTLSEKDIRKQGSSNDIHCGKSQLKFHSHVQYHLLKKKKKRCKGETETLRLRLKLVEVIQEPKFETLLH